MNSNCESVVYVILTYYTLQKSYHHHTTIWISPSVCLFVHLLSTLAFVDQNIGYRLSAKFIKYAIPESKRHHYSSPGELNEKKGRKWASQPYIIGHDRPINSRQPRRCGTDGQIQIIVIYSMITIQKAIVILVHFKFLRVHKS